MNSLVNLMKHKSWVESEFYAVLGAVPGRNQAGLVKEVGYYLNHIHIVDQIFKAHLTGQRHGFSSTVSDVVPPLEQLSAASAEMNQWLIDYAGTLDSTSESQPIQFTFTDGDAGCLTRGEMLIHLSTHAMYHLSVMTQPFVREGLKPPRVLYTTMRTSGA